MAELHEFDEEAKLLDAVTGGEYKYGFTTAIETHAIEKGLNEDTIRTIWRIKGEPDWMLERRLNAYRYWRTLRMPDWAYLRIPPIDYDEIVYYAAPGREKKKSLEEVDPEILDTFNRLGIPLTEQKMLAGVAVDAVMDSTSVATTFREKLAEAKSRKQTQGPLSCCLLPCNP